MSCLIPQSRLIFCRCPQARRAVILTNAGGPRRLTSDALSANGLLLEDLEESTRAGAARSPQPQRPGGQPGGYARRGNYLRSMGWWCSALLKDKNVDIVLPILVPHELVKPALVAQAIVDASRGATKPVLTCIMGDASMDEARVILQGNHLPMYVYPETPRKY